MNKVQNYYGEYRSNDDVHDQMKFVRKVYAILATQLSLTFGLILWV